ncbi:hypothetical protein EJB05_55612, partial [Eragrostis curvula]
MSQPSYVHVGAAASQKPAFTLPRFFISNMCEILFVAWLIITPWYYIFYDLPPRFSVQLAPAGRSLDVDDTAAPMPTAFHGALHASNRRATERCNRDGEVAVTYGGFAIASGRVPGFCVPAKGCREVPFLATADGGVDGRLGSLRLAVRWPETAGAAAPCAGSPELAILALRWLKIDARGGEGELTAGLIVPGYGLEVARDGERRSATAALVAGRSPVARLGEEGVREAWCIDAKLGRVASSMEGAGHAWGAR